MTILPSQIARRAFLHNGGIRLGAAALSAMLSRQAPAKDPQPAPTSDHWSGVVHPLHRAATAKRIIWLYMAGGMTHLDTFDHKPLLAEMHGQPMPESCTKGQQIAQLQGKELRCLAPQHRFRRWGDSGQSIAEIWPELASKCADDLCIVRSLKTEAINHDPAHTFLNTGTMTAGRPSMGSWLLYGLGCETNALPGFVVMVSTGQFGLKQPIAARQWHSGFLPGQYQGVEFRATGDPVLYLGRPDGVGAPQQREVVDAVRRLNGLSDEFLEDPEIATRISQYELAFRMQASVPELLDVRDEPNHVFDLYGTRGGDGSFAANCLLARRLAERGVRFIQLYHRDWDHHNTVGEHSAGTAREVDRGAAALIMDLKQRGMLHDTIVILGSEFGRTPMAQGNGRDHHIAGFTMCFAGGGFKPGFSYGATDELGYHAVDRPVAVRDVHATLLHLMGIDHARFTVPFQGLDSRLTGVEEAHLLKDLLT